MARPALFVAPIPRESDGKPKIRKVFIANRGEIACRIIATCRKVHVASVAAYAEEDASSRHVLDADEAICLGSIQQKDGNPFLNRQLLISNALSAGADAVHPGYGYLSENAQFADDVRNAGLIFIGPSAKAMLTLGDKRRSKDYLRKHAPSVPLIPGFTGSSQNLADLEAAAEEIGYPIMVKASAGGGGRGLRIVHEASKLREELQTAQSEAARSFGSSDCILEKYIEAGKHIEVQIMGDSYGQVLSLWERECSVQRRHQKIIEETPSPFLTPEVRKSLCAAAVKIGQLLNYEGAGTVEFVLDVKTSRFYFLEVNTRLQVEHPITEEVAGLDLVSLQLYAAAGGRFADLPALQSIPQQGHAIECRLCAEDPQRDFMPEHGNISLWRPYGGRSIEERDMRFETAVQSGTDVTIFFDSMIAKIVVWAPRRIEAIEKMIRVLANTACVGVKTNQLFLQSCLLHPAFQDKAYTTSLIPHHLSDLLPNPYTRGNTETNLNLSLVAASFCRENIQVSQTQLPFRHVRQAFKNQRTDPVNLSSRVVKHLDSNEVQPPVLVVWEPSSRTQKTTKRAALLLLEDNDSSVDGAPKTSAASRSTRQYNDISNKLRAGALVSSPAYEIDWKQAEAIPNRDTYRSPWIASSVEAVVKDTKVSGYVVCKSNQQATSDVSPGQKVFLHIPALGTWYAFQVYDLLSFCESMRDNDTAAGGEQASSIKAPMPCKVLSVLKQDGDTVDAGETVIVVESMKMEMNISMTKAGTFRCSVANGDFVDEGQTLCSVD